MWQVGLPWHSEWRLRPDSFFCHLAKLALMFWVHQAMHSITL